MLTPEQLELRRQGIGSSDIAPILGISPFRTAFDVYLEKVEGFQPERNFSMELGDLLEPVALELYTRRTGATVHRPGTVQHPSMPWVVDTVDGLAVVPLEAKAPRWMDPAEWGEEGTDQVPDHYIPQCQWHLFTWGAIQDPAPHCEMPVLFGASEFRIYRVGRDDDLAGLLIQEAEKFLQDHVRARKPPPLDGSRHAPDWLAQKFPKSSALMLEALPGDEDRAAMLRKAQWCVDQADADFAAHASWWKQRIGEAGGVKTSLGNITWKSDKRGVRTFRVPQQWRKDNGER